jgi:hypothetical protein
MRRPYLSCNYFERNAARVRYPKFRKQGLFVGSGVIEARCGTLIATRLKRSGMFWTVRGANEKTKTIRNPSQRAAGLFPVVLRIDGESLVILAGQTRLPKCLDITEKVYLSCRLDETRPELDAVQLACGASFAVAG